MKADGYALFAAGKYTYSVTTMAPRDDGFEHRVLINAVGEDSHINLRVRVTDTGIECVGLRIKDRGEHIGPDKTASGYTTEAFARLHVELDKETGQVTCQLADVFQSSVYSAQPTIGRDRSNRSPTRYDLPFPDGAKEATYDMALLYDPQGRSSTGTYPDNTVVLKFAGQSQLGIQITATASA